MSSNAIPLILVVDDEPTNVHMLENIFARQKLCETHSAHDGQRALELLGQHEYDLVLLDVMMPGINGLQVLEQIRANPDIHDLPVILVTARVEERDIVDGLSLGANDYILKPYRISELIARSRTQLTLKRLQDERKESIANLEQALAIKDRFLRIASHDLKSPINNLQMILYMLRRFSSDGKLLELVESGETNLALMQNVIEEFVDSAALQTGSIEVQITDVVLVTIVEDVLKQYQPSAAKKGITLQSVNIGGVIRADYKRLIQAFSNLISNAIKYSPVGSTITIWVEVHDRRTRLYVGDQGPGIADAEREKLFSAYGKLSNRPTGGESSTGLGLWITRHLMRLQAGDVGHVNAESGGSIFWIEMPTALDA